MTGTEEQSLVRAMVRRRQQILFLAIKLTSHVEQDHSPIIKFISYVLVIKDSDSLLLGNILKY